MTTGRTHLRYARAYVDGYDMSGYTRSFGPLGCTFDEGIDDSLDKTVKGAMIGSAAVSMGTLNGLFDNTATSGIHVVMNSAGGMRNVMLPQGILAAPANNDPVFAYRFIQLGYTGDPAANPVSAGIQFGNAGHDTVIGYAVPWGVLLHAKAAETAANTATGLDELAQTTLGGWMMYQVFAGNGTATIKVQDASTNSDGSFTDLLSSGSINCSSPTSGIVKLAHGSTVKRYTRFQIALGTATTVTFALSWHRSYI